MTNKYRTEYKPDLFPFPGPITEYVIEKSTGKYVGEVDRWDWEKAGDKIADGNWRPYDNDEEDDDENDYDDDADDADDEA